jgi:putative chitinase
MNVLAIQKKLKATGYDPGPIDGDLGPKTYAAILDYVCGKKLGSLGILLARAMAADFPKYGIVTPLRIAHFIAQSAHETGRFRYLQEIGSGRDANHDGYDDYLQKYDFRKDLGNNAVGMGPKYRGRGIFQLTGYFNYAKYGKRIGIDLTKLPEKAAEPEIAVLTACLYWTDRNINAYADKNDVVTVTKKINGGTNGLQERRDFTAKLMALLTVV